MLLGDRLDIWGLTVIVIVPAVGFGEAEECFSLMWVLSLWVWDVPLKSLIHSVSRVSSSCLFFIFT